jgi:glycosyltransferase involved in cell wall biosynthesis
MDCSIIICTRNRALSLEKTLRAFQSVNVPSGWEVEMIVADNGSSDHTAKVIRSATHAAIRIHYIYEARPGKSRAQNAALEQARGEVLLFTDDDVEPADNWLENMARPLLENRFDAAAGRILLADDLRRPWFARLHGIWLAEVREPKVQLRTSGLVGASMGIRRDVFDRIGHFDEELGPGAAGFGEETLVWLQMKEADMRVCPIHDTFLIHRPDLSRLLRSSWLASAKRFGRTQAYLMHHWEHTHEPYPELRAFWTQIKLLLRRLLRRPVRIDGEGCPDWEMSYLVRIEALKQFVKESRRPRNYELRALRGKNMLHHS